MIHVKDFKRRTEDLNKATIHPYTKSPNIIPHVLEKDFTVTPTTTKTIMSTIPLLAQSVTYVSRLDEKTKSLALNLTKKPSSKASTKNHSDNHTINLNNPNSRPVSSSTRNSTKYPSVVPNEDPNNSSTENSSMNQNSDQIMTLFNNQTVRPTNCPSTTSIENEIRKPIYFQIGSSTKNPLIRYITFTSSSQTISPTSSPSEVSSSSPSSFPSLTPSSSASFKPTTRKHEKQMKKNKYNFKSSKRFQFNIDINSPDLIGKVKIWSLKI